MTATDASTEPTRSDIRSMTRDEGESLLAFVRELPDAAWDTMTVCEPWTVRHLVAHLTALGNQTFPNFLGRMIRHGFDIRKVVDGDLQKYLRPRDEMVEAFERSIRNPSTPGQLSTIALGEFMVHGEDVRRALGERGEHPSAHVAVVGPAYVASGKPLGGKRRAEGLSLTADDGDFAWGAGPEVRGPGIDLLLAVSGRADALDSCSGDGVEALRARC